MNAKSSTLTSPHPRPRMSTVTRQPQIVFLIDIDNTLLDNDRFVEDLRAYLDSSFGHKGTERYFELLLGLREQLGYVDYFGAIQLFRLDSSGQHAHHALVLLISSFFLDYPFRKLVYPHVFETIKLLTSFGLTVLVSDGDAVFQPYKIRRAGLWNAVRGRVLVFIHKEKMIFEIEHLYPASHYVLIDDKPAILAAMKVNLQNRITTVLPKQGHYALDATSVASFHRADVSIQNIGDLMNMDIESLFNS